MAIAAFPGVFPSTRLRRNRSDQWTRRMVAEHHLSVDDLIWPAFVIEGSHQCQPVTTMPGVNRLSIDLLVKAAGKACSLGIPAIALFPAIDPSLKNEDGSEAINPDNLMCRAVRAIKAAFPDLGVITDVALDPYTSHSHDGLVRGGQIVNDETVAVLVQQALVQAEAGADIIAPSDMMDGRVAAIRSELDRRGFKLVRIMAYAAKYASAFYRPFRDAVGSNSLLKDDKKTYQMDPANSAEALREVAMDLQEGADMIIVKPGSLCLDIVHLVKEVFGAPTFAYQVSGEYAMLKAAAVQGWLDWPSSLLETLMAFKRAGCNGILTYGAVDAAQLIRGVSK
jgi:porphobilinogen synthase